MSIEGLKADYGGDLPTNERKECCCGSKYPNLKVHTLERCYTEHDVSATHKRIEEIRIPQPTSLIEEDWKDKAIRRYEEYANVHSETNFTALLRALQVAEDYFTTSFKEKVEEELRNRLEVYECGHAKAERERIFDILLAKFPELSEEEIRSLLTPPLQEKE